MYSPVAKNGPSASRVFPSRTRSVVTVSAPSRVPPRMCRPRAATSCRQASPSAQDRLVNRWRRLRSARPDRQCVGAGGAVFEAAERGRLLVQPRLAGERADLDRHEPCHRGGRCHRDALVQVGALEQVEAGDELLGLHERAVGHQRLAVADTHRSGRVRQVEGPAEQPDPLRFLLPARDFALHDRQVFPGGPAAGGNEVQVLHLSPPRRPGRRGAAPPGTGGGAGP